MDILRQAAQQALEALVWHDETVQTTADSEAITVLCAALAQPEQDDADAIIIQYHEATIKRLEKRIKELESALAHAAMQEEKNT
jgi:hypothetical protein